MEVWLYSLGSVFIVSLISLIGVFTLSMKIERLRKVLIYMISFSAGALLGGAFLHLLPRAVAEHGFGIDIASYVLVGIGVMFIVEKVINWRHCHLPTTNDHPHPFAWMNLFGDGVHNFIDGLVIGGAYLVDVHVGIATTIAVVLHEIPQEIGDFGVLIAGGFSKAKALMLNFASALTAVLGVVVALLIGSYVENLTMFLLPFAAGGFVYIASADLIPEMHKTVKISHSLLQFLFFVLGIGIMLAMLLLE
ncbi:MAG: ZIP family metal transporter [Nitrospirae bacterium]|nr:ZIP family metal transporter [Nitrospirota bacterium]